MKSYDERRTAANKLRERGYSYNIISEKLGVPKSTLSYWVSDIAYKPNKEVIERIGKARAKSGEIKSKLKMESIKAARKEAKRKLGRVNSRDLFMLGIGLYIGEGEKTGVVRVINADPEVIKISMKWFMESFGLSVDNFTLSVHLYPDNNVKECLTYWSRKTGIPLLSFGKTQIDRRKNKKMAKRGKLRYGTARLTVRSNGVKEFGVFLSREISSLMESVLK